MLVRAKIPPELTLSPGTRLGAHHVVAQMFSWRGAAATIVVGLLLCPGGPVFSAQAQPGVVEEAVTGYVLAPEGTPVSGGTVVTRPDIGSTMASIDRTGRFRLVVSRSGLHQILVNVPGLAPYRIAVTVPASRSLRLPVIRLVPAAYFRVRVVSAAGEPITALQLRWRLFDLSGNPISGGLGDRISESVDNDAIVIGPLPRGITTLAADNPSFAQTRLPDLSFDGAAKVVDGGTIVIQQPGAVLHVDVLDGAGAPVPEHWVYLEDTLPRSPLVFRPVRTNQQGRVSFDRLAAGRYRLRTVAVGRCGNQLLATARVVALSGSGTSETRLVVGGRATFRIVSPFGPVRGMLISAEPDVPPVQSPFGLRSTSFGCRGTTDLDGRVTLTNFPPGPAHVEAHMANSTYVRRVEVSDGREVAIVVPEGFLPVRVVNALTNQPVAGAAIMWTGSEARVEATATATGEALLEAVGTAGGTLAVSARGYQSAEEQQATPPGNPHDIALMPVAPPRILLSRVISTSGEPLANAVVELISANPAAIPRVSVTGAKGVVAFSDVPSGSLQLIASADGFVTSTMRVGEDWAGEIALTLSHGYRVIASVDLPATDGPQVVRVVNDAGASIVDLLDSASDRSLEPPGRLSLGPLAPGAYVIELHAAGGRREERIRIVDRDVYATFR
jgi:protocatechuate 3,4-dioxygenase beta subunit